MINKVILIGNVGADPEVRALDNGVKCARIRIATTEKVYNKEKNESRDITEWHNVTLWRGLAEVVDRYVHKGTQLYIEGKLRTREYDKNGVKCFATEIVADELKLLGKRDNQSQVAPAPAPTPQRQTLGIAMPNFPDTSDEMPF
jgi:single-strand DNA-binding protein